MSSPLTLALNQLHPHPAQMRTQYDLDSLAGLTLQLHQRGLDAWQPILVSQNGEGYQIISGHRRQMALLLSLALRQWVAEQEEETEMTVEIVRPWLQALVEEIGSLEQLIAHLGQKYGEHEIPAVPFNGSQKAEILALQSANYGGEQPDTLGVAHSFQQAVEAGATVEEIARNCGQHPYYVRNHLALTQIPAELARRIAAGELPLSVAAAVADLPEPKRTGLAIFLLANLDSAASDAKATAKMIKGCAATLKKWPGLQPPLLPKHQTQRNMARALVNLWSQAVEAYPEDAYAAAAMLICRQVHDEPWANQEKLALWFRALGGDTYFNHGAQGGVNWTAVVQYLLTEVACESCPIGQLPPQRLRSDLSQGQGGPLGMPCRVGEQADRCVHGLAANDSFDARLPWDWGQHPGVVSEGGDYRAKSYEDLLAAWQAQAAREGAEDEAERAKASEGEGESGGRGEGEKKKTAVSKPAVSAAVDENDAAEEETAATQAPIARQRRKIAAFMQGHERLTARQSPAQHPFATPCGRCRHRLDSSPTKDETVPHCAWAGRLRSVSFQLLQPEDKELSPAPVCRQFAPSQPWHELIPAHPSPPGAPRDWLKEQILHLAQDANRQGGSGNAFEFLTGRPMGANENYKDWFERQLTAQSGDLNDAQLFTLFVWAHAEWRRARGGRFSLPVNGHSAQFAVFQERPWPFEEVE